MAVGKSHFGRKAGAESELILVECPANGPLGKRFRQDNGTWSESCLK